MVIECLMVDPCFLDNVIDLGQNLTQLPALYRWNVCDDATKFQGRDVQRLTAGCGCLNGKGGSHIRAILLNQLRFMYILAREHYWLCRFLLSFRSVWTS
jgi:hypothetical protein